MQVRKFKRAYIADVESEGPPVFQDFQADRPEFVNVRVEDLGLEQESRGFQGIILWEDELCVEFSALIGSAFGARYLGEEMSVISRAHLNIDRIDWMLLQHLHFLREYYTMVTLL
jgi:hypothetical protein